MRNQRVYRPYLFILLGAVLFISACSTYHPTPQSALTKFPGYLTEQNAASLTIVQQEKIADGLVLLYRYQPDPTVNENCLATTFVTQENNGGWRAQSAGRLGCGHDLFGEFSTIFTVGGGITTAYGLSRKGHRIRVRWSDGVTSIVPIMNNVFLKSRSSTLQAEVVELLDADGTVLEHRILSTGPES